MSERPGWDEYFMGIAAAVAKRADCTRRQVGCVIVGPDHRIVSTGYNGGPAGGKSCLKGECPRGRHYRLSEPWARLCNFSADPEHLCSYCRFTYGCACGDQWPCEDAVQPGSSYDTGAGSCISVHAEANALIYADFHRLKGGVAYVTAEPCDGCARLLVGAGLAKVVYSEPVDGALFTNTLGGESNE